MAADSSPRRTFPDLDPDERSSNPSGNRTFGEVVAARLSRRDVLRGGAMLAAAGFLATAGLADAEPAPTAGRTRPTC